MLIAPASLRVLSTLLALTVGSCVGCHGSASRSPPTRSTPETTTSDETFVAAQDRSVWAASLREEAGIGLPPTARTLHFHRSGLRYYYALEMDEVSFWRMIHDSPIRPDHLRGRNASLQTGTNSADPVWWTPDAQPVVQSAGVIMESTRVLWVQGTRNPSGTLTVYVLVTNM